MNLILLFDSRADVMEKYLNDSNGIAAFKVFNQLVSAEERSYRMIPAQTVSMFSMLDGITHLHSKMTNRRINIEVRVTVLGETNQCQNILCAKNTQ